MSSPAGTISPRAWVELIGGREICAMPKGQWRSFDVGLFRFGGLPEQTTLPPLDRHFVSFTVQGPLRVERELGGSIERGDFRRGSSLIMAAGQQNTWRWDRPTDELQLFLDPAYLSDVAAEAGAGAPELIDRFAFEDPMLRQIVHGLLEELRDPGIAGALFGELAAQYLAVHLLRRHCAAPPRVALAARGLTPGQVRRLEAHVGEHLGEEITLDDLAACARMSRFHFAHAFKQATGTSPHRWLVDRRIERAKTLLCATDLGIGEVARAVGFASQSHFGAVFRVRVGASPRGYRHGVEIATTREFPQEPAS